MLILLFHNSWNLPHNSFPQHTYKSYDLFLSQLVLIHMVTHCISISNISHNYLIYNIFNLYRLFTSPTFILSVMHYTSVHVTSLLY